MPKRIVILGAALLAVLVAGCPGGNASAGAGKGKAGVFYPVEVETVTARKLDYTITANNGSVEAFEVVQITARVAGAIEKVLFKEGQEVEAEQVLVEIEPERFKLEVDIATASETRAKASFDDAESGLRRRQEAVAKSPGVLTPEEIETWKTRAAVAKAEWDEAKVNSARAALNQTYAKPISPVKGIIQTRTVQTGQYVQPGTVIATLLRRDPLLVRFEVPEREASALSTGQQATFRVAAVTKDLRAEIIHVAGSARGASRMVAVTAQVHADDVDEARPGSFALVTIVVSTRSDAPTIPESAVRPSAEGFLAFVVNDGDTANKRVLELGLRTADGRVEVKSGVSPGETLVIRGGEALRDGAKVSIKGPASAEVAP